MKRRRGHPGKGHSRGAAMMVWLFFANLFEPRKAAAIEHIQRTRDLGAEAHRTAATPAAPPPEQP